MFPLSNLVPLQVQLERLKYACRTRLDPAAESHVGTQISWRNAGAVPSTTKAAELHIMRGYKKLSLPEGLTFFLANILLPENATVLVVKDTAPNGDIQTRDAEVIQLLSDKPGTLAKVNNTRLSGSIRRALWRTCRKNRENENKRCRWRYKESRNS